MDCSTVLIARNDVANPISNPYVSQGAGIDYDLTNFFTLTPVTDCEINCYYGDNCGDSTISRTNIFEQNVLSP